MPELLTGEVTHYYSKLGVAAVNLQFPLHKGDHIHVLGHTTDIEEIVDSMEIYHHRVDIAEPGDDVAIEVVEKVREGDKIYREMEDDGSFTVQDL